MGRSLVVTTFDEIGTSALGEDLDLVFTVEHSGSLFKRSTLGLHTEEEDVDDLEDEPDGVDEVVLPLEGSESDGVGVLIENDGGHDTEVHACETLGTNEEGQDLDGVGNEQWCVGNIVETREIWWLATIGDGG